MLGPPEIVAGIVMYVMTSLSVRPASRAKNPPIAWIPSWELPASRITASWILRPRCGCWPPADAEESATCSSIIIVSLKVFPRAEVLPESMHLPTQYISKAAPSVNHDTARLGKAIDQIAPMRYFLVVVVTLESA